MVEHIDGKRFGIGNYLPESQEFYGGKPEVQALAEARALTIRSLSKPGFRRSLLRDPNDIALYDELHKSSEPMPVETIRSMRLELIALDNSRLSRVRIGEDTDYIRGVVGALGGALGLYADGSEPETPVTDIETKRAEIVESIGDGIANIIEVQSEIAHRGFVRRYPKAADYFAGFVAGYQWVLGQRRDLMIDAEVAKFGS